MGRHAGTPEGLLGWQQPAGSARRGTSLGRPLARAVRGMRTQPYVVNFFSPNLHRTSSLGNAKFCK